MFQQQFGHRYVGPSLAETGNVAPDGLPGAAQTNISAAKILKIAGALFVLLLVILGPLAVMFYFRAQSAAAEARKVERLITATAVAAQVAVSTATSLPVLDYRRPVMPTPRAVGDGRQAGTQVQPDDSATVEGTSCQMRHQFIYDSGSWLQVVGCGDSQCEDQFGNLIPKQYLACAAGYPRGLVLLPTATPLPPATPTPLIKWKVVEKTAACPPCPECVVPEATLRAPLASDQIEVCWHIDGIRGLWIDGQGVAGHDCQVFAVPFDGGNEAVRGLEIKVQR